MLRAAMNDHSDSKFANALKALRTKAGLSQEKLAEEAGISVSQVSRFETNDRDMRLKDAQAFSRVLQVPIAAIAEKPLVPLVGYVGAGSEMAFFAEAHSPDEFVKMPPNGTEETVAVEIRGDSLGSSFSGWCAYYDERREPPTEDLLGALCVIGLRDGRVLVKKIVQGRQRGHYDLWSHNAEPLLDQEVDWAARVTALLPK
jgi:transcriptional regulator with XRE-family HTH domain